MEARNRSLPPDEAAGDPQLPVAGLGGRSYAFLFDWHVRAIAGIAWYLASVWISGRELIAADADTAFVVVGIGPALAIYLLYHPAFEILTGSTPGKRAAGVCIVDRRGRPPGIRALIVRNVLRPVDSLAFYAVGIASVLVTKQAVRIGDVAAGTLLVYTAPADSSGEVGHCTPRNT